MAESLRIAMVAACPFPWPRGTPIRIERIAEAVARRGHAVHVVTYHLGGALADPPFVVHRIRDVAGYRHTAPGPTARKLLLLDPMLGRLLRRLHGEIGFDLVHAHHYEGLLVASLALQGTPIVYDAHTLLTGELPTYSVGLPRWLLHAMAPALDRWIPRRADRIIAVSEAICDAVLAAGDFPPERLHLIPNGVEWNDPPARATGDSDGRTVIFTGNLAPYQGVDLLLRAFATLRSRLDDVRLMIVTDASFVPYEKMARGLGIRPAVELRRASFTQQSELLAGAAVAVNPRVRCDGIPQKLLNYMAAGMPIATFESSGGPVRHEVTGLRVPDGDTAALADAIERLLTDRALAQALGDAARVQVRRDYSWSQVGARVEEVYFEAVAGARASSSSSAIG